jgi:RHS repeat-associated protein
MATRSSSDLGVSRIAAWVPTSDTSRTRGPDPGTLFSAGRRWTPFGLIALGHTLSINLTTGGLVVSVNDLSIPYQAMPLQISRLLDIQEQHTQQSFLDGHPNADPRFHFFANWQLHTETQVTASWNHAFPELLLNDGDGESALFYREYSDFDINEIDSASVESRLRSYGVPGRTLSALAWQFASFDLLLRTRRGSFGILTGRFEAETMVDPVDLRLWRFEPITGMAYRYTSEFAYQEFIGADGLREVTVPSVWTQAVDALGHSLTFHPTEASPPHRSYVLADGSSRSFRLELDDFVSYLDGNSLGGRVKSYVISRAIDQTRNDRNVIQYKYDNNQRLVEVLYPGHANGPARIVKYEYDGEGHLVGIIDPVGDSFTFDYAEDLLDSDNRLAPRLKLTRIADQEGNSISYRYDHPHQQVIVTFTGADGVVRSVTFRYQEDIDDTGERFITSQTMQVTRGYSGSQTVTTSQTYSNDGRYLLEQFNDPLGNKYRFEYNGFNQTIGIVDPTGHKRDLAFDVRQTPTPTDPNRYDLIKSSEENVDVDGNPFPVASSARFCSYDAVSSNDPSDLKQSTHRVASRINELGKLSTYDYDDRANANPLCPTIVTDPLGKRTQRSYDPTGSLLSETDATGNTWRRTYNTQGQILVAIDANGFKRYWVYDPGTGWLTDATDALGNGPGDRAHSIHYEWNEAGQRLTDKDAVNAVTKYEYFRNKRLRTITRYDPVVRTTTFDYDAAGTLTGLTDPLSHQTVFRLDEASRLYETFRGNPNNPAIRFIMDAAGLTNRNGQTVKYDYDALGRMTSIKEPSWPAAAPANPGKAVTIIYDFLGHRLKVIDSQLPSASTYRYDAVGNLRKRIDPFGSTLNYDYNGRNDIVRVYDTAGVTDLQFERDDAGRLSLVTDSMQFDPSRQFRYFRSDGNLLDNLYRIEFDASGMATRFQYDPNRQLTQIAHLASGQALLTFGYGYRADGLIGTATGDHQGSYDYDGLKQVVNETDAGMRDGYDGAGNRLWRAAQPVPADKQNVFDVDNRLMSSPLDGTTFAYDTGGNLLSRTKGNAVVKYTFDAVNRLMRVEDGGRTIDYLYDVDGRVLQRIVTAADGSTSLDRFRYANRAILVIVDQNGEVKVLFTRDDEGRLLRRRGRAKLDPAPSADPHSLFYLHDGFRSVARLVDWDGKDLLRVDYDAWGQGSATGKLSSIEPFRYRSGPQDPDTGLLNFGARWYDPICSRWLSQDPIMVRMITAGEDPAPNHAELVNLYAYVRNNPLAFYDLDGLAAVLPKGWPEPPGWKGGYKWKNGPGRDRLTDPEGEFWHWHPKDEEEHPTDHWDYGKKNDKRRLDKDGKDLGEDAFKEDEPKEETSDDKKSNDGQTAERAAGALATVGVGVLAWEIGKWVVAGLLVPETAGASLAAAALTP